MLPIQGDSPGSVLEKIVQELAILSNDIPRRNNSLGNAV